MTENEREDGQCMDLGILKERVAPIVNFLVDGGTEEYREQVWTEIYVIHYFLLSRTQRAAWTCSLLQSKSWPVPSATVCSTCPRTRIGKLLRDRTFFHVHNSSIGSKLHWGPAYTLLHPDVLHKYNLMVLLSSWLMFCPVVICCRNASSFAVGPHWNSWRPLPPSPLCTPFFVSVHRLWATLIGAYRNWRCVLRPTQLSSYRLYYLPHKIALPAGMLSTLPHKQIYQVLLHQKCTKDTFWPRLGKTVRKNSLLLYSRRR